MWMTYAGKHNTFMGPFYHEVTNSAYFRWHFGLTYSDWLIPGTFEDDDKEESDDE